MFRFRVRPVEAYVGGLCVAGFGGLGLLAAQHGVGVTTANAVECFVLFAFVAVTEFRPIIVPRCDEEAAITPSAAFAVALLLVAGPVAAALALGTSSIIADLAGHKAWWKVLFNAAQYGISLMACAGTLVILSHAPFGAGMAHITAGNLFAVLAAGLSFSVTNLVVTEIAVALAQGRGILSDLVDDFIFQMSTAAIFLALAPVAVVLGDRSLILVPLLAMPLAAIYKSAATSMAKDYQSLHDTLTGLPNRSLFRDRVEQAIQNGQRDGSGHAIMIIDLDRFKEINDTLGHHIGDLLLQEIGPRLSPLLRTSDTVARLGGDEFGVLLRGVAGRMDAEATAAKIVRALQESFEVKGMNLDIDGSIGIALYPEEGDDVDVLIQRADVAMYRAKEHHNGWESYSAQHDQYTVNRLVLVSDLRRAVENNDFLVYYQPKIDLQSGEATGVEALVRWDHHTRGMVMPDEFIPVAERTGMMRVLTLQVLEKALRQCHQWHHSGLHLTVAVNISARNLQDLDLPEDIGNLLARCDVPARSLELEITESTIMADPARAMGILFALHNMGIRLAIDDFGTGYSSLAYLKRLPVNEIKIDKSFITHLTPSSDDAIIVRSTVDMAASLGLTVLAEGVENADTMQYLRSIGCQGGQGYFMSRPLPPNELANWVADWQARAQLLFPTTHRATTRHHSAEVWSRHNRSELPISSPTV